MIYDFKDVFFFLLVCILVKYLYIYIKMCVFLEIFCIVVGVCCCLFVWFDVCI